MPSDDKTSRIRRNHKRQFSTAAHSTESLERLFIGFIAGHAIAVGGLAFAETMAPTVRCLHETASANPSIATTAPNTQIPAVLDRLTPQIFLGHAQRRLFERGIPIFTWHYIAAVPAGAHDPFLYVGPEEFDAQLSALSEAGFSAASLDDIAQADDNLGKKVAITFDDGCRNVLANALDILARHKFYATQFLVAGLIGKTNKWDTEHGHRAESLMDEAQIREWIAAGHSIGSHSLTHRNLTKLDEPAAHEQIFASRKKLEDTFGVEVRHFSYPHGRWNEQARNLVAEAGYATACTTQFGVNTRRTPPLALSRIAPLSASRFLTKIRHRLLAKLYT